MNTKISKDILVHLSSFWQTLCIHKRKSDFSGEQIISVFPENCPYPVWHKDEWLINSNPSGINYDSGKDFWKQVWDLFQKCPIAHNIGTGNENCEYSDDAWYSKNCYLCHSFLECEDCAYLYRCIRSKDSVFCVFSFDLQKCSDVIYGHNCHNLKYAIDVKDCNNCAFLFDCRNCEDCLLCWNLRDKKYCIANIQYKKEEYEIEIKKYNLSSRKVYDTLRQQFTNYITNNAWWKNLHFKNVEKSSGDFLDDCKNCSNCFGVQESEDCSWLIRGMGNKSNEYTVGNLNTDKVKYSTMIQDNCYDITFCSNIIRSKYMEYCINCYDCENCFLCASLVGKRFYILNKKYSEKDYEIKKEEIVSDMKKQGVYGDFFPAYFSATSYDESVAGMYYPLSKEEQKKKGFRISEPEKGNKSLYNSISTLPDKINDEHITKCKGGYRDKVSNRPFQVKDLDISFSKKLGIPLNDRFYIRRLKENFGWMFPTFELRETKCAISGKEINTSLPKYLDSRIVSLEEYDKLIY